VLRTLGVSFGRYLGEVRDRVPAGVSMGILDSVPALLDAVRGYLDGRARRAVWIGLESND